MITVFIGEHNDDGSWTGRIYGPITPELRAQIEAAVGPSRAEVLAPTAAEGVVDQLMEKWIVVPGET